MYVRGVFGAFTVNTLYRLRSRVEYHSSFPNNFYGCVMFAYFNLTPIILYHSLNEFNILS